MGVKNILWIIVITVLLPGLIYAAGETRMLLDDREQSTVITGTASRTAEPIRISVLDGSQTKTMELEEYLVGVVLGEMPGAFQEEALKAQAVVARTYTLKHHYADIKHLSGALCTDHTCCQAYRDPKEYLADSNGMENLEKVRRVVDKTRDQVLLYSGELIDATYFSSSGGYTEAAAEVWGADVPYLQAVESPGEEISKYHEDTVTFSAEEFCHLLGDALSGAPETWFGDITYTTGGGVDTVAVGDNTYTGTQLRSLLGLRSAAFSVEVQGQTITITTRGFGHRVGMSQYGAEAMARAGSSYGEILEHYYPGTTLENYPG